MPRKTAKLHIGRSGQLAVVSEFLFRGYNVAIPEIDGGEDIFVIEDDKQGYWAIQVKTGKARPQKNGTYFSNFNIPVEQLRTISAVSLTYVFVLRLRDRWEKFVVIPRADLFEMFDRGDLGTQQGGSLNLRLVFSEASITCGNVNFSAFDSRWHPQWPALI